MQTIHPETEEIISVYLDKKRLAYILAEDIIASYATLIASWSSLLIDYFAKNCVIHQKEHHIEIFNHDDFSDQAQHLARSQYSHKIIERKNNEILNISEK